MLSIQLVKRLMVSETEIKSDKLKGATRLEPYEWEQLNQKIKALTNAPIYIDDTPSLPVTEFRSKVKRLVRTQGVELVIVDYLQLMQGPVELRGLREQEVAAISRTLKATAKEMNIPIIALSQLSRASVQREKGSGRPMLSDLRESGSIEQDADMVMFVHRPDYIGLGENPDDIEKTELIIAKHRNGEIGDIPMRFKSDKVRFEEIGNNLVDDGPVASSMNDDFSSSDSDFAASNFE